MTLNIMKGELSALRARIHLRLIQLGVQHKRRAYIVNVAGRVNSVPRLTAFVIRLESRLQAGQPLWRTVDGTSLSLIGLLHPPTRHNRAPSQDGVRR